MQDLHTMTQEQRDYLKQLRYDKAYMDVAEIFAGLSHDEKHQVGCCIVSNGQILSQGWNGMVSGMDNQTRDDKGNTKPEVVHSEANALMKLAKNGGRADEATLYCTHSPCYTCSGLVIQSGIKRVVYRDVYDIKAIKFLQDRGIMIEQIKRLSNQQDK